MNHQEFKSCLRSLGYDLPMVEEGEPDPEFEAILDTVDPNRSHLEQINSIRMFACLTRLYLLSNCENCLFAGMETCHCRSTWHS